MAPTRWFAISLVVVLVACKKPTQEQPTETPTGPPKVGHSITKLKGSNAEPSEAGSGGVGSADLDAGGSNAAYRDGSGRVHGPGGPVFMGRGAECDLAHDHCIRPGTWFAVGDIVAGRLYRAVPVFAFEDKWWNWRGDEETVTKLFKTKAAGNTQISAGTPVIWFSSETSTAKWAESEYEGLTSSRWEAGVVDVASGNGQVRIKGWGDMTPMDTVRVIVEQK